MDILQKNWFFELDAFLNYGSTLFSTTESGGLIERFSRILEVQQALFFSETIWAVKTCESKKVFIPTNIKLIKSMGKLIENN